MSGDNPYVGVIQGRQAAVDPEPSAPASDNPYLGVVSAHQVHAQASGNLAATDGVSPQAAQTALTAAPGSGVPADVGMHTPQEVQLANEQAQQQTILAQSAGVRNFVAQAGPATVAAVKDKLPTLAQIGAFTDHINDNFGPFPGLVQSLRMVGSAGASAWTALQSDVQKGIAGQANVAAHPEDLLAPYANTAALVKDVLGLGGAVFAPVVEPLARTVASAYSAMGVSNPLEAARGDIGTAMLGLAPSPETMASGASGASAAAAPLEPLPPTGAPHPSGPEGRFNTTPEGMVADEAGNPVPFRTQREAAQFAVRNGPSTPQIFDVAQGEGDYFHVKVNGEVTPPVDDVPPAGVHPGVDTVRSAVAHVDTQTVSALQKIVGESEVPSSITEQFLTQELGHRTVTIDPDVLVQLASQGHEPFPELARDIANASATGTDVEIPMARYITATAGQPFAEALNAATTFREGGGTTAQEPSQAPGTLVPPGNATPPSDLTPAESDRVYHLAASAQSELQRVIQSQYLDGLFTKAKDIGMNKDQLARYSEGINSMVQDASDKMLAKAYAQVLRERKPDWQAAVAQHVETLTPQIESLPAVRAMRQLSETGFKLDRDLTTNFFPGNAARLPKSVMRANGNHPDEAAELLGYPSAAQLVSDLADLHEAIGASGARGLNAYVKLQARNAAEAATRAQLGFDLSPENIHATASEMVNTPALTDFLSDELRELAARAGLPFDADAVKAFAATRFEGLRTADALNLKKLESYVYKGGVKAERALLKGDFRSAFIRKQQQFIHHLELAEAHKFTKEFARTSKLMTSVARKPVVRGMDQEFRNHLRAIVESLGVKVRSKKFENVQDSLRGKTLEQFIAERNALFGQRPAYVPLPSVPPEGGLRNVSVAEFRGYADMMQSLATLGRDERTVQVGNEKRQLADLANEVRANADAIGRRVTAGDLHTAAGKRANNPSLFSKVTSSVTDPVGLKRSMEAAVIRGENILFWLDRQKNGPLMKSINGPLQAGDHFKAQMIKEFSDAFKAFSKTQPKDWAKSISAKIEVPELTFGRGADGLPVRWLQYKSQAIMAARYLGERTALDKLLKGFGWDEATFRNVLNRELSEADWRYVQHTWEMHERLVPAIKDLYRKESGLAPAMEEALPVPTPHGTLPGGHVHVTYDWDSFGEFPTEDGGMTETKTDPTSLGQSDLFGNNYRTATPSNKYTLARTNFSAPVNLDHNILPREYESIIHDLAYRSGLIQAAKVMRQPAVRQALSEVLGPEYLNAVNSMLKDTAQQANYDQSQLKALASFARGFRKRFVTVQIGYNVATILKHGGIAASHIQGEVGLPAFIRAQRDISRTDGHWKAFVYSNSGEVRNAQFNLDRDVREALGDMYRTQGFIANYQYHGFTAFTIIKQWEAQATWLAKYRQLVASGEEDADAMALADKAVRDTQGSGSAMNLPAMWRGTDGLWAEVGKLSNMFTGFENTATNRIWTASRESNEFTDKGWAGGRRDFHRLWGASMAYLIGPALYAAAFDTATHGKLHDFAWTFAEDALKGILGGSIPMGTTIAGVPQALRTHEHDLGSMPLLQVGKEAIQSTLDTWHALHGDLDKVDDRWVQHALDNLGVVTNIPTKPIAHAAQYVWDLSHNHVQDANPVEIMRGLLFGPTPEQARK